MTDWVAQDDWSKVAIGDQVRATCEGQMLTGEVVDTLPGAIKRAAVIHIQTGAFHRSPRVVEGIWQLFVPAKPAVLLPTEPGHYVDRTGNGWNIREGATSSLPEENAPYTRLEPVAVTAKKVLDRLLRYETSPGGYYKFQYTEDQLRSIFSDFGVRP
jgi:hypothetical protein